MLKIYPYSINSQSAKDLALKLGIIRCRPVGTPVRADYLVNWGCSDIKRQVVGAKILNCADSVKIAANKLSTFFTLNEYGMADKIPSYTESRKEAATWIEEGNTVVCRTKLNAHSGAGIVIADKEADLVDAPLYTEYVPKTDEYRIHVMKNLDGTVNFYVQRKARDLEVPDEKVNWKVRNHSNGFIYMTHNVIINGAAKKQALDTIEVLGLDFGAVDVIYNTKRDKYYVLEVNTAPGLSGTTLDVYAEYFKQFI